MRGGLIGFLVTLGIWVVLLLVHMGMEAVWGRSPFAVFTWDPTGRYVAITVAVVLALGTGVGIASDRVRSGTGR
ncbi:MAG: hypothetical protein AB2385_06360 [Symbiobacterium sp.]|uniref:hypothetical protein n=1 Tax=Symbiobacterium sp. TaxID=1971213 RepID=UPI00346430C8